MIWWAHVPGRAGVPGNELADVLAVAARKGASTEPAVEWSSVVAVPLGPRDVVEEAFAEIEVFESIISLNKVRGQIGTLDTNFWLVLYEVNTMRILSRPATVEDA